MLRILHTSDWHLGLELSGHDRLPEQQLFLDWLLATCQERAVDALLVCGDVYDTANPSVAAQRAFAHFLADFHAKLPHATLVVIAGNHDSAARLELPRPFGEALGRIHLRGLVTDPVSNHLVPLCDARGEVAAWCLAVPFLRASDLDCRLRDQETPAEAYVRAVEETYAAVRAAIPADARHLPVVAMGHLTLAGSRRAGSERILIGGVESVPTAALSEGCDYVALGHIHRAQTVGTDSVRYCGSPYPVDFDESRHRHLALLIELEPSLPPQIKEIETPIFVPFLRFCDPPGSWQDLEDAVAAYDWTPWASLPRDLQPLVELRYDSAQPVGELRSRCEALCHGRPFRLVSAPRAVATDTKVPEFAPRTDLKQQDAPEAVLLRHWQARFSQPPPSAALERFREVLAELAVEGS